MCNATLQVRNIKLWDRKKKKYIGADIGKDPLKKMRSRWCRLLLL
jgi:hypothetical protein